MALEHAILVSLAERSATGYDLARRFDASIGHFWKASHQQIYKVLGRMETSGQVSAEHVAQPGRPDKKVYALTDAGRQELLGWLGAATPAEQVRSEFAVKIRALHLLEPAQVIEAARARRSEHERLLEQYRTSMAKFFPDPSALAEEQVGPYLALRGGIRLEENGIGWCDEIIETLDQTKVDKR